MKNIGFSILVVDDDADDRFIIDDAFLEIGYASHVKKFINGKMLFTYLEKIEPIDFPSLIVLDNTLPELNAEDILTLLKENPSYKSIPVVVYTSSLSPSKQEKLMQKGVYACYEKGEVMEKVVQLVKQLKHIAENNSAKE